MRKSEEVESKFYDLQDRRLRERKKEYLSKFPQNCQFNCVRKTIDNGDVRFCRNEKVTASHGGLYVCDSDKVAASCSCFISNKTEEKIEEEFEEIMASPSRCGNEYPKLAILIWFLQDMNRPSRVDKLKEVIGGIAKNLWYLVSFRWY